MLPKHHIIIADDDDAVRSILTRIVARTYPSARISAFADGKEALDIFDAEGADLVITNYQMGQMDGLTLIRLLRQRDATVPIVMVSGHPSTEPQALALGVSAFVTKPIELATFVPVLTSLLPPA